MECNARPHRVAGVDIENVESQADLLRALTTAASENVLRLAGRVSDQQDATRRHANAIELNRQHEIADALIARLLAMPASAI